MPESTLPEWTRVRDKRTGHEYSVRTVSPDKHQVLKGAAATDRNGRPLPTLHVEDSGVDVPTGYDAQTVTDLKDEIEKRNAGRDEADHIPTTGNKSDLIDRLQADDEPKE